MSVQHQSLGASTGGQPLVILHYTKVRVNDTCYENRSTFFYRSKEAKKKMSFQNVHFWLFENRLVNPGLSHSALSKTNTFLETSWKINLAALTFHSSETSSSEGKLGLTNGKVFSKITFFQCSASTKITQWP